MSLKTLNNFKKKDIEEENVIIGSGAGGSTTAIELLKKYKKSLILEEGPSPNNVDQDNIGKSIVQLYKNNGATPIYSFNGGPLIGYGQGSCVGGSTYVNAGYFSNTPKWIFDKWINLKKTNMSYNYFQNLVNEIRDEIDVSTEDVTSKDNDSQFLYERAKKLNWSVEKCERFSNGKPPEAKQSMNVSYHKKLHESGVDIIHDCKVTKINSNNGEAKSLIVKNKINNQEYKIKFKNLFVNCGPVNTPHLLLNNKIINYEKNQNNFEFHINFKVIVRFKEKINSNFSKKFDASSPASVFFMREFEKEGVLLSAANSEIPYLLATTSHFSDKIKKDLHNNFENYAMYVYQIQSKSYGQVKNLFNTPYVNYKYDKEDLLQIKTAINRLSKFFLEEGAESILFPIENSIEVKDLKYSKELSENINIKKLHLVSVHGMGSLRAGAEQNTITDYSGKIKNFNNIFINDASILPGNTGESPQASIMAFAKHNVQNNKF